MRNINFWRDEMWKFIYWLQIFITWSHSHCKLSLLNYKVNIPTNSIFTTASQIQIPNKAVAFTFLVCGGGTCHLSFQPDRINTVLCLTNDPATWSQPHTGKWPTSFPHHEMLHHDGMSFLCLQLNELFSPLAWRPRTQVLSYNHSRSVQVRLKAAKCSFTWSAKVMLPSM